MADLKLFDLDYSLNIDSRTRDFKEIYNSEVVNQMIDLYIGTPYRIGQGLTNNIFQTLFTDITLKTQEDLQIELQDQFERFFQFIDVLDLTVEPQPEKRRIWVRLTWSLRGSTIAGYYTRYWSNEN
jgi:hypothetical protein